MTRTIDTHTHVLADDTIGILQKEVPSIGLKLTPIDDPGRRGSAEWWADAAACEVAGTPYRPFPRGAWDIERRLADMDAAEVDVHVLSATPQTYLYGQEPALAAHGGRHPERRHRQTRQGEARSLHRHRDLADPGAGEGRRGARARHAQARPARRHDRLQLPRQESRRSELRAAVGESSRARCLHDDPPQQCRRRRPAALVLSRQSDRQSARHHDCGGMSRLRRRARALSEIEIRHGAWRRLHALSGRALGARLAGAARAESDAQSFAASVTRPASITTPSCIRSRRSKR